MAAEQHHVGVLEVGDQLELLFEIATRKLSLQIGKHEFDVVLQMVLTKFLELGSLSVLRCL